MERLVGLLSWLFLQACKAFGRSFQTLKLIQARGRLMFDGLKALGLAEQQIKKCDSFKRTRSP